MTKKRIISFVLGSTALATSMCFLPLADAYGTAVMSTWQDESTTHARSSAAPALTISERTIDGAIAEVEGLLTAHAAAKSLTETASTTATEDDFVLVSKPDMPRVAGFTMDETLAALSVVEASYEFAVQGNDFPATEKLQANGAKVSFFGRNNKDGGIFVDNNDGTAYIAYRGSSNGDNWLQNLNGFCADDEEFGGRYHAGMLKGYKKTSDQVWAFIEQFSKKYGYTVEQAVDHLTLTGHSRGGGEALIAADMIRRETGFAPKAVTFAAPRSLSRTTAEDYNNAAKEKTLNIAQGKDPVHYANASVLFGAVHVGVKSHIELAKGHVPHTLGGYRVTLEETAIQGKHVSGKNASVPIIHREGDYSVQGLINTGIDAVVQAKATFAEAKTTFTKNVQATVTKTTSAVTSWIKSWF